MIRLTLPYPISARMSAGQTFGSLTVVEAYFQPGKARCRCVCGAERVVKRGHLTNGHTTSCGCMRGKANATHRAKGTPTHNSWCAMKQRCNYPAHEEYHRYGARGITVCARWAESFEAFLADMGERPVGMTIERDDTDGNYEPGNCRWATPAEQNRNRSTTIKIERDGKTMCVKDWCEELGLDVDRVYGRIRRGATPLEALL